MKRLIFIIYLALIIVVASCNKANIQTNFLVDKWNIINDSSSITSSLNGFNGGRNYIGASSDYYNFTSDSSLYIKEGLSFDTGKYSITINNKVEIVMFSYNGMSFGPTGAIRGTFDIVNLTANTATLTLSGLTPEGQEYEIIKLKK